MADTPQAVAVVTYSVVANGIHETSRADYDKLTQLLADGYRVLDVFSTPTGAAGEFVSVTVLLTQGPTYAGPYSPARAGG